jgi:hypothetical protein
VFSLHEKESSPRVTMVAGSGFLHCWFSLSNDVLENDRWPCATGAEGHMTIRKGRAKGAVFGAVLNRGKAVSCRCLYRAQKNLNRTSHLAANNRKATDLLCSECGSNAAGLKSFRIHCRQCLSPLPMTQA